MLYHGSLPVNHVNYVRLLYTTASLGNLAFLSRFAL